MTHKQKRPDVANWTNALAAFIFVLVSVAAGGTETSRADKPQFALMVEQVTYGVKHHFFGYIGQCQTIPWNASGRYIVGLEIDRIDRMPRSKEAATIILVDTKDKNRILRVDKTHAWNPQQGSMFYWNPLAPETQFFFNDRDVSTGEVFTVIYDIERNGACASIAAITPMPTAATLFPGRCRV